MDTKWKKWKIIVSFAAFVAGVSLLLCSLCVLLPTGQDGLNSTDYQDTAMFRRYISDTLDVFLSAGKQEAAFGGHWDSYEYIARHSGGDYYTMPLWDEPLPAYGTDLAVAEGTVPDGEELTPAERERQITQFWDDYMAEMAVDRNLLYAVARNGELVYTNMDGLTAKSWKNRPCGGFESAADTGIYNFLLSFNSDGDGRVSIIKDDRTVDVYGDGWYTMSSDWCLPGYNNFTVDTGGVEIYLAVAETPQLYLTTNEDGISYYAYELYDIYHSFHAQANQYIVAWYMLIASIPLLLLALIMHKSKRRGDRFIIRQLGKLWFLPKLMVLIALPVLVLWLAAMNFDATSPLLILCFWLLYLGVVDLIGNRKRQRIFLREYLREKDLQRTVQQKLVHRNRLTAVVGLAAACAALICAVAMFLAFFEDALELAFLFSLGACGAAACAAVCFVRVKKDRRMAEDIGALMDQIEAVKAGNLNDRLTLPEDTDLRQAAQELNDIQQGLETALQEQMKSERMKVELITNVSHDIKTPLTSIISYVELLRQEELSQTAREFVDILGEKSQRLKLIVQDVFEVSKAAAGQLPVNIETLDLAKLLRQTLADMAMTIEKSGLAMRPSIPESPVMVRADGQRLYRVFQNLLQNALQYSLPGSRVFLVLTETGGTAAVQVKNTSAMALDDTVDFTERFVRGDESRTDGGSGLGLSIAKSFAEACGGRLDIAIDADLFTVTVTLPLQQF